MDEVDRLAGFEEVCERAHYSAPIREDMRSFIRPEAFDLALSVFTSFGYFDDKRDDPKVLTNLHQSLRAGGSLVMDVMSKERLAKSFQATASQKTPDGSLLVQRHEILDDWTRVKNEWTIIRDGQVRTFEFNLRVYSGQELRDLLSVAGFSTVKLFGGLDGRPYGVELERLVAVGPRSKRRASRPLSPARARRGVSAFCPRVRGSRARFF